MFLRSTEGNRSQGTEHPPSQDKIRCQRPESQSPQIQMPRHQCKIIIISCSPGGQNRWLPPRRPRLTTSAVIWAQIQLLESVHPNIYSIYKLLGYKKELFLQNQMSLFNRVSPRSHQPGANMEPLWLQPCWESESMGQ